MPRGSVAAALPVVLVANREELVARSVESLLAPAGYAVVRAYTGRSAAEHARTAHPDAIILGTDITDPDGITLCRMLRADAEITPSTPIFMMHPAPLSRQQRLEALRAGACELWGQPLDTEEFLLRLAAQLRSKRDADQAREAGLVDRATGLYNGDGLERRVRELLAEAARLRLPLSIVVFGPDSPVAETAEVGAALARALRDAARLSDAVARLANGQFAVVAPATDADGAVGLSERLLGSLDGALAASGASGARVSAGYESVADPSTGPRDAETLIGHAVTAFRRRPNGNRIRRWVP